MLKMLSLYTRSNHTVLSLYMLVSTWPQLKTVSYLVFSKGSKGSIISDTVSD